MKEIEALLEQAHKLQVESERVASIPYPPIRQRARRHFQPKKRRFLELVETTIKQGANYELG